ncbi:hypothetical protein P378_15540 [Desulforamulus profundi]|uniref:Mutator family transposase n=1 Tax=Desulforamulus profundi TaxID=1383067 RepID=A0A2C6M5Z8_9FIRM|nr:hypothetical protein P378_15540 [Desulforamulus profundi]
MLHGSRLRRAALFVYSWRGRSKTEIQLCVIHQIRNSLKYVPYKEQKELMADLKKIYQALTIEEAELAFTHIQRKVGQKAPHNYQVMGK